MRLKSLNCKASLGGMKNVKLKNAVKSSREAYRSWRHTTHSYPSRLMEAKKKRTLIQSFIRVSTPMTTSRNYGLSREMCWVKETSTPYQALRSP